MAAQRFEVQVRPISDRLLKRVVRALMFIVPLHAEGEIGPDDRLQVTQRGLMVCDICGKTGAQIRHFSRTDVHPLLLG